MAEKFEDLLSIGVVAVSFALLVAVIAAWITHWIVAIGALVSASAATTGYAVLLIVGIFFPPVGVVHGIGVWFGAW